MKKVFSLVCVAVVCLLAAGSFAATPTPFALHQANQALVAPTINGTIAPGEYMTAPIVLDASSMKAWQGSHSAADPFNPAYSAKFWIVWDATYLYVAARVVDPNVVYLANQGSPLNVTDGIQLCLDHQNLRTGVAGVDPGMYIHDLVPGQLANAAVAAYFQHWPATPNTFPNTTFAGRTLAPGYEVEMRIKWSDCTPNVPTPAIGLQMGYLALLMNYGANQDLWWNGGNRTNVIGDPANWNTLELTGPLQPVFNVDFESAAYTIGAEPDADTVHIPSLDWNNQHIGPGASAPIQATAMGATGGTKSLGLIDGGVQPAGVPAVIGEVAGLSSLRNNKGVITGRMLIDVRGTVATNTNVFTVIRLNPGSPALLQSPSIQFGQFNGRFFTTGDLGNVAIGTAVPVKDTTYRYDFSWDLSPAGADTFTVASIKSNPGGVGGTETELLTAPVVFNSVTFGDGIRCISFNTNGGVACQVDNIVIYDVTGETLPPPTSARLWSLFD